VCVVACVRCLPNNCVCVLRKVLFTFIVKRLCYITRKLFLSQQLTKIVIALSLHCILLAKKYLAAGKEALEIKSDVAVWF